MPVAKNELGIILMKSDSKSGLEAISQLYAVKSELLFWSDKLLFESFGKI